MSAYSGKSQVVRAIKGSTVLFQQNREHVYISLSKAHIQNTDNTIESKSKEAKIQCMDDEGGILDMTGTLIVNGEELDVHEVNCLIEESKWLEL